MKELGRFYNQFERIHIVIDQEYWKYINENKSGFFPHSGEKTIKFLFKITWMCTTVHNLSFAI